MTYSNVFGAATGSLINIYFSGIPQCVPLGVLVGEDVAAILILILAF